MVWEMMLPALSCEPQMLRGLSWKRSWTFSSSQQCDSDLSRESSQANFIELPHFIDEETAAQN